MGKIIPTGRLARLGGPAVGWLWLSVVSTGCSPGSSQNSTSFSGPAMPLLADFEGELLRSASIAASQPNTSPKSSFLAIPEASFGRVTVLDNCTGFVCRESLLPGVDGTPVRVSARPGPGPFGHIWLVTDIGLLFSADTRRGRVLRIDGGGTQVVRDELNRPSCAYHADLDEDGDLDVVICEFGHINGSLHWLELEHGAVVARHDLDLRAGTIDVDLRDLDGDGHLDMTALVAQETEELIVWQGRGGGQYSAHIVERAGDPCFGHSEMHVADLDADGDFDLITANGDTFDAPCIATEAAARFGLRWYENLGGMQFASHVIDIRHAVYAITSGDFDEDGNLDLAVGSHGDIRTGFAQPLPGIAIYSQVEPGEFELRELPQGQFPVVDLHATDLDGDGALDLVGASLQVTDASWGGHRLVAFSGGSAAQP